MDNKPAIVADLSQETAEPDRGFDILMSAIEHARTEVASSTPLSSSADHAADADIDDEILVWIASHVQKKIRLKSTLMGLAGFLTGIGATLSGAAPSIATMVDMIS